jgi:hypothetical protein
MTRTQVNHLVAARTGESLAVIRRLGFQLQAEPREEPTQELRLALSCPFCRRPVAYPGRSRDGSAALAECEGCDVYFSFEDSEVFPASPRQVCDHSAARRRYIPA